MKKSEYGAKKIRRLVHNKFTKRSRLTEESIVNRIRESTVDRLSKECTDNDEIWVAWDESEFSSEMQDLMKVRSLNDSLVNGYRMFFGLAMIPGCKGVLHQRVFSSSEDRFSSQNDEITTGIIKGIKSLEPLGKEVYLVKIKLKDTWKKEY